MIETVHVKEITMAAPDIIRVRVRDQEVVKYPPVQGAVEAGGYFAEVTRTNPYTGASDNARVVGRNNDYLKFYDKLMTNFADRAAMDNVANYPTIGGRTVTAVYRSTLPYEQAVVALNDNRAVMEHMLYLKLSDDLPEGGPYTISITGNTFPATQFTYDDKFTRCSTIASTSLGHRPADGRKIGYAQLWLPNGPNEGAVDLATDYGFNEFHIINTKQRVVFTGTPTVTGTPTTVETGLANAYYPTMNTAPKTATAVNSATDTVTVPSHGYVTGQYKYFSGFEGVTGLEGAPQITVVDADNFTVSPGFSGTWVQNYNIAAHDSKVYDAYQRGRYGTHVYLLDYSAFVPNDPAERYKIWVPGFGVSDEFMIHDAIYHKYAHNSLKGVYNQCIGIPLSASIGGWDRPVWGRDGVNGCEVFETMLPGSMHSENPVASPIPASNYTEFITTTRVTDFFGGMMDAGDHDWHVNRHFASLFITLDIGYERLPSASRNLSFGFPKASSLFTYEPLYDDIDDLSDIIHMAVFFAEPLRRTQKVDGRVYAGMQYKNPLAEYSDGKAGNRWDPPHISPYNPHLLAADHASNYHYAMVAAKLGKLLQAAGNTVLGQKWIDSAQLAWDWAEAIYHDYANNGGIASPAWIAYYVTILDLKTRSGMSDPDLTTHFDILNGLCTSQRFLTAACLYTAYAAQTPDTDSAPYFAIIDAEGYAITLSGNTGAAAWEYSQGPTGNAPVKAYYNGRWWIDARNSVYASRFTGTATYKYSGAGVNPWPVGPNSRCAWPFFAAATQVPTPQPTDNANDYLKIIQEGENFVTGANGYDCTCVTGIGLRQPHSLHTDREALGIAASDIPGYACYMGTHAWPNSLIFNNLGNDSQLNFTCSRVRTGDPTGNGMVRLVEPLHHMIPHGLTHFRNTLAIYCTETDLANPLFGRLAHSFLLHAWDGNTETTQPKTRFFARCS